MRHGSLFSGIGGFDLAAEWMGWENVFHCEWNEFGQKILKYYWPDAISYGDITKTDFIIWRGQIDILTGGFPCQPYSLAGKRKGKEDERHLWLEMLRAIREIQPCWVVGENVPGIINWSGGLVFNEVQTDLEAAGYEVFPVVLPACGVNAPHKRERIWFVAHSKSVSRRNGTRNEQHGTQEIQKKRLNEYITSSNPRLFRQKINEQQTAGVEQCDKGVNSDTTSEGCNNRQQIRKESAHSPLRDVSNDRTITNANSRRQSGKEYREKESGFITEKSSANDWQNFPTQSPLCSRDDGFSSRLDGITFPKWRNESIKGYGNAIVPQVVYQIFKAIEEYSKFEL